MSGVRIIGSRPPAEPVLDDLPDGVDRRDPYTVGPGTPRRPTTDVGPARGIGAPLVSWLAVAGLIFMSTVMIVISILAHDDADVPPRPVLNVTGDTGEDRVDCRRDVLRVDVDTGVRPSGVAIAWLESDTKRLRVVLDPDDDGYTGVVFVAGGVASTTLDTTGDRLSLSAREPLIVRVEGLLEASRVAVDNRRNPFSWMGPGCG